MRPSAVETKAVDGFVKKRERIEAFKEAALELEKSKKARDLAGGTRSAGLSAQEIVAEKNKTLPSNRRPSTRPGLGHRRASHDNARRYGWDVARRAARASRARV